MINSLSNPVAGNAQADSREDIEDEAQPTKLEIPSKLEIDSLENNNPSRIYQLTVLHPVFTFYVGDVRLEAGFRCLDVSLHTPMYALRNVKASRNLNQSKDFHFLNFPVIR